MLFLARVFVFIVALIFIEKHINFYHRLIFLNKAKNAKYLYKLLTRFYKREPFYKKDWSEPIVVSDLEIKNINSQTIKKGNYEITFGRDYRKIEVLENLESILNDVNNYSDKLNNLFTLDEFLKSHNICILEQLFKTNILKDEISYIMKAQTKLIELKWNEKVNQGSK